VENERGKEGIRKVLHKYDVFRRVPGLCNVQESETSTLGNLKHVLCA